MFRNEEELTKHYEALIAKEALSHKEKLEVFDAWCKEGVALGFFTSENVMDGIEGVLRIAKAVNSLK